MEPIHEALFSVPTPGFPGLTAYYRVVDEGGWRAEIEFKVIAAIGPRPSTQSLDLSLAQSPFEAAPAPEKLAIAFHWLADLDAMAYKNLNATGRLLLRLPPLVVRTPVSQQRVLSWAEYWSLQFSPGELIRPLFLKSLYPPELRSYQEEGVRWLMSRSAAILADDMGLGKTAQCITGISGLLSRGELRSAVVVCPRSLIPTWLQEFRRWAPAVCSLPLQPLKREKLGVWLTMLKRCHVAVTNYEQLRGLDATSLPEVDLLVADEAHRVRNLTAEVTRRLRRFKRKRMWALTGTPVERDRRDLATLLSTVAPSRFAPSDDQCDGSQLRSLSRPFVLRRLKRDVLPELPPVLDQTELLELTSIQKISYRKALHASPSTKNAGDLLATINALRQICDLDAPSGASSKIDRIVEHLDQIRLVGEKGIAFSYYLEPLRCLRERLRFMFPDGVFFLEGAQSIREREEIIGGFKSHTGSAVLLASSRVASEGLTLTEANHVFFVNQWWNPSANNQARDRVVRMGQKRPVRVLRFLCINTIEEVLETILKRKTVLIHEVIELLTQLRHPLVLAQGIEDAIHAEENL